MWASSIKSADFTVRFRRPLVWCAWAGGAGTLAGQYLPGALTPFVWAAALVPLAMALWSWRQGRYRLLAVMAAVLLAFTARSAGVFNAAAPTEGEYTAVGTVAQTPNERQNGRHVSVHLRDVRLTDAEGRSSQIDGLYWTAYVGDGYAVPAAGSVVRLAGRVYEASGRRNPYGFDFRLYLKQNHLSAGLYNSGDYTVEDAVSFRGWLVRLRCRLLDRLDRVFGERSALPKALLLGERQALSEQDRQAFAQVGIAHVLAVSGLHISLLVAALSLLVSPFLSGRKRLWLFGPFLLMYVLLLDFRASVVRAAILTFAFLYSRSRGRSGDSLSALALAFLLILMISPVDLMNAGFQLSFAAALGIVLLHQPVYRLTRRALGRRAGGLLASTVSAVAGTALPSIQTYHCFSVAGLVFSPIVCAMLACLLPLCLAALALSYVWPDAAHWLAWPVGWALQLMSDGMTAAAQWPYMSVNCPSVPLAFYPLAAASLYLFSSYAPRRWKGARRALTLCVLFVAGTAIHLCTLDNGVAYLQMDVGSADCAVVQDGRSTTVVDCGLDGRDLSSYLLATGRNADILVLTHLHTDHCMGAQALMDHHIRVGRLVLPVGAEQMSLSEEALALLEQLKAYCGEVTYVSRGASWQTGRTAYEVLWPEQNGFRPGRDANDYCLCLRLTLGETEMLLASDLTGTYEPYVGGPADVLKVAHHGSRSSSTEAFLEKVSPRTALISVASGADAAGADGAVPARLEALGADVYTTAESGAIRIDALQNGYRVTRFFREGTP